MSKLATALLYACHGRYGARAVGTGRRVVRAR